MTCANNISVHKKARYFRKRSISVLSDSAAFTLIELLIAMAIVGVLAAISVTTYNHFIQKAREITVIVYLRNINKAEKMYLFDHDDYTGSFYDLENTGAIPEGKGGKNRKLENYKITLKKVKGAGKKKGKKKKNNGIQWFARADPVDKNKGFRWFYIDETGVARFENGEKADANSPKL